MIATDTTPAIINPPRGKVLRTRLDIVDYEGALARMVALAHTGRPAAVAAANTHLVAEAAYDPSFAAVLATFDLVVPDGMPLVWALRQEGCIIQDRVYGPYLMQHALEHAPENMTHYFFGGSEECLLRLQERARSLRPGIKIAGAVSPPFGAWDDAGHAAMIDAINDSGADFVWVALGGVRQEIWIAQNRHRFTRGVFIGVGDAFSLLAGMRAYAPAWMQRCSLTWLHRLASEPRRLLGRYLKYNSRFVWAYLADRVKRVWSPINR